MITLDRPKMQLREATVIDALEVHRICKLHERPFIGAIGDVPAGLRWWVAVDNGHVVACMGFAVASNRRMIVSDFYDDGTRAGKRGLSALLRDSLSAGVKIYMNVPFDRPDLKRALERRGIVFKSWGGEYPV